MNAIANFPSSTTLEPTLLTAEEFVEIYSSEHVELVKGVVKELPMPMPKHGKMCFQVARLMGNFIVERDLGHVMTNDSFIRTRRGPDSVRGADVCYFSYERLPKDSSLDGLLPVAPDLVVEVRSPSETWTEVFTKVGEYLAAGVRAVVVIDDVSATASVYRNDAIQEMFQRHQELTLPDVLPGFSILVEKLLV